MYRVLIADDNYEDRELVRLEIERALKGLEDNVRFVEAVSVKQAMDLLRERTYDLLTLDIEFDRLAEGIEALPGIFEEHPTLNVIVISGKLNKSEVTMELFRFTKDNVLKGKRWLRHFDVLDKKDDKTEALRAAYDFALKRKDSAENVRDLFSLAETYLDKGEAEKCLDVYRKIQEAVPGEKESDENIKVLRDGGYEQALEYLRRGESVIAGLLLGHFIEIRLKGFTRRVLGRRPNALHDCVKGLERAKKLSPFKKELFHKLMNVRNKSMHHPDTISEQDFEKVMQNLKTLEARF